ncbi:PP2C family serine/threonine-protein phosphatase [Serratia fonticola]|uniref:PP2C family serine/threonine-protein phosphatase n=1 Tax=Serratia fonticola TaxID=47917 RepID=UPI0013774353|nr:PP2C family serine/threonine-protein phosphatase [Serratia fonticola]NCG53005.1 protein phosphatase 2C domain-containing protein [Serratia fonticola]
MQDVEKLRQNVLMLILAETGATTDDAQLASLQADDEIGTLLTNLITKVTAKTPVAVETTEAPPLVANDDTLADEPKVVLTKSDDIPVAAPETAVLPTPDDGQKAPFEPLEVQGDTTLPEETAKENLKPGQIPSGTATPISTPQNNQPQAKINVANARTGVPFHSEIDIVLDDGTTAEVLAVTFSKDIGITFDPATSSLAGTATESGDFDITVTWSCPAAPQCTTQVPFIVNPDPRSLWKILEPPADSRYFKPHVAHQQIQRPGVNIVAASRRGRSHEHAGTFRDDDFYIASNSDTGWNVMLVADGAGSAKNSREGSRIATQTVGDYLTTLLNSDKGLELKACVENWGTDDQRIVWEAFNRLFRQAAIMAVNNISNESIRAEESAKSYSTTLLVTVSLRTGAELFAASFWLGDGAIAAYGPVGKVRVLGTPDSGEYAGQTRFLDADAVNDTNFSKRISIGKWTEVSHLVLMTDGVSDPRFETDNGLQNSQKWDDLIAELTPCLSDPAQPAERLAEWLNFFSPGNHDDRTLIVAW